MGLTALGVQLINNTNRAMQYADQSVNTAQSGLNAVLGGQSVVSNAVSGMNQNAATMNQVASDALATANQARAKYDELSGYANILNSNANALWNRGNELTQKANSVYGQADALLNMNASIGGIASEYLGIYNLLSPDRYVSQAASDVQGAYSNAWGQSQRNLARTGVSADSGAARTLQKQYAQSLATALAAAKTKARQTGIDEQAAYLDKMMSAANTLYGTANTTEQNAQNALTSSTSATKSAADLVDAQAQGYVNVGGLQLNAGELYGTAATTMGNAANLNTNYLNVLNNAYGNLSGAQSDAAKSYINAEQVKASAFNGTPTWTSSWGGSSNANQSSNNNISQADITYQKNLGNHSYNDWLQQQALLNANNNSKATADQIAEAVKAALAANNA